MTTPAPLSTDFDNLGTTTDDDWTAREFQTGDVYCHDLAPTPTPTVVCTRRLGHTGAQHAAGQQPDHNPNVDPDGVTMIWPVDTGIGS
jgi:hypothetical protein